MSVLDIIHNKIELKFKFIQLAQGGNIEPVETGWSRNLAGTTR